MTYVLAVAFTLVLWWVGTIAILFLDRLPARTHAWSMAAATGLMIVALFWFSRSSADATASGAAIAFACAIVIWGWQLLSFYTGYISGPRKHACEPGLTGWQRFVEGVRTSLYHELVVIACGVLLVAITWNEPNQIGTWTYLALYWMHQSAKLNLFLGARNLGEALLPPQLAYLATFMRRRPMNLLFPVSVTVSTIITILLAQRALAPDASAFEAAGYAMLATIMALAVLEHWLLVVPLPVDALWQWGLGSKTEEAGGARQAPTRSLRLQSQSVDDFASDYEQPAVRQTYRTKAEIMPASSKPILDRHIKALRTSRQGGAV
jgi:putative photosynthetic complex assembly protein 2